MAVDLSPVQQAIATQIQTKAATTTDAQELVFLAKAAEALKGSVTLQAVTDEGALQVGRVQAEAQTQLTVLQNAVGDNVTGLARVIETPIHLEPAADSTTAPNQPWFRVAAFGHAYGNRSFAASQFQVTGAQNVWAGAPLIVDTTLTPGATSLQPPAGGFTAGASFWWRVRFKDNNGVWSAWSTPTRFTVSNGWTGKPSITVPAAGASNQPVTALTISTSAFSMVAPASGSHTASEFQVKEYGASWDSAVLATGELTAAGNRTSCTIPNGTLANGKTYAVRARHKSNNYGWGPWSEESLFTCLATGTDVIGIAMTQKGGEVSGQPGAWQRIDASFNNVSGAQYNAGGSFWNTHSIWGNIQTVTIDGQTLVRIPKFYVRTTTAPSGNQAGRNCWLISSSAQAGFICHPAFLRVDGSEAPYIEVGAFLGFQDGGPSVGSQIGKAPWLSADQNTWKQRCGARNTQGGALGWRMWSIWDWSAIAVLMLIETGHANMQGAWGRGFSDSATPGNTGASNALWRGINDLWGHYWQMVDGFAYQAGNWQVQVLKADGSGVYVTSEFGFPPNSSQGGISSTDQHTQQRLLLTTTDASIGCDTRLLFLPSSIVNDNSPNESSFASDTGYFHMHNHQIGIGGRYNYGDSAGMFARCRNNNESHTYGTTRLARTPPAA